ncbi:hypothetical protein A9G39_03470 [Gilliamella sp. Imp1-6]|nr:hypothetical protein A9G39_03470 [Gilliamella apicola]
MRIIIAVFFMFLLAACHTRTAEEAYKEGKYLESINLLADSLEDKGTAKLGQKDVQRLQNIVNSVMQHYETTLSNTNNQDYAKRIECYQNLLAMKLRLSDRFYSQEISFLIINMILLNYKRVSQKSTMTMVILSQEPIVKVIE